MCGGRRTSPARLEGPYYGETTRLSAERGGHPRCHGFPWWILWIFWPLMGGLKWAALGVPLIADLAQPLAALLALALIGLGLGLLLLGRQDRAREDRDVS